MLTYKMCFRASRTIWIWSTDEMIPIMNVLITIKLRQRVPQLSTTFATCVGCRCAIFLSELFIIPAVGLYMLFPIKHMYTRKIFCERINDVWRFLR